MLVSKGPLSSSASYHAQGGIAAACGEDDSPELHAADTIRAGRGLCRPSAVETLVDGGAGPHRRLVQAGASSFDAEPGLEGGHSRSRVFHARGAETGREIELALARAACASIRASRSSRRSACSGSGVSGGRCAGVIAERRADLGAGHAAGDRRHAGALWSRTTNPRGRARRGDRAWPIERAPRSPTSSSCSSTRPRSSANGLLLTEALRGEGALLLDDERRALHRRAGAARRRGSRDRRARQRPARPARRSTAGASRL